MTQYDRTLESKMKVRFEDCDPFNHLNNSRYIDYIVTARTDQLLENYNLDIYKLAKEHKTAWVSAQTQISYLVPAWLAEEVTIQTRLLAFSGKSLLVEGLMWDSDKKIVKAVMWAKLVHFNLSTQKSHSHTPELLLFFDQVVDPLAGDISFETRVKELKKISTVEVNSEYIKQ